MKTEDDKFHDEMTITPSRSKAHLEIATLGGLSIHLGGYPLAKLHSRKAEALLVYLAVTGRPQPREVLADLLWEDFSQKRAMNNLRVVLSNMRKHLGDHLLITRDTIAMNPEVDCYLDVEILDSDLSSAGELESESGTRDRDIVEKIKQAIDLYKGEFLEGFFVENALEFDAWMVVERERFHYLVLDGLGKLVRWELAQGEYTSGIRHASKWVQLEPLSEAAHRQMMRLLTFSGERSAALAHYEKCQEILAQELGVQPEEQTRTLFEQIRGGDVRSATEEYQPSTPTTPKRKESFAPVEEKVPNLPAFLADEALLSEPARPIFVARERELKHLNAFLDTALADQGQVAFVCGEAGNGKTALTGEFVRLAQERHSNLLVAVGNCNAHAGVGDAYLPFRDMLGMLTGDLETQWAAGFLTREGARRLWDSIPQVIQALLQNGQDLVDIFVPGEALLARIRQVGHCPTERYAKLEALVASPKASTGSLEQRMVFEQYTKVLMALAAEAPLVLVLEDLQWADAASCGLLFHLGRRIQGGRILVVGTYRPAEVTLGRGGEPHPLKKPLVEFKRDYGDTWIDLRQPGDAEGRAFVNALLDTETHQLERDFREALYLHTGGNPLYTVELLRALQERGGLVQNKEGAWIISPTLDWGTLPARVEGVIEERIGRLEGDLRETLRVASVEGEDFTAQVVARVREADTRGLVRQLSGKLAHKHRLVGEMGVQQVGGQRLYHFRFRHNLFQRYLYDGLGEMEREVLHGDVAEALEALYGEEVDQIAPQLAYHYTQAGLDTQALPYLIQAGHQAAERYANEEAIALFNRALDIVPEGELEMRFNVALAKDEALFYHSDRANQLSNLNMLEEIVHRTGNLQHQAAVAFRKMRYYGITGNFQTAIDMAPGAEALSHAAGDVVLEVGICHLWGWALWQSGNFSAAFEPTERALELARTAELPKYEADCLRSLGVINVRINRYEQAIAYYHQALEKYRTIGNRQGEAVALSNLGVRQPDIRQRMNYLEQALSIALATGNKFQEGMIYGNMSPGVWKSGDLAGGIELIQQAITINQEVDNPFFELENHILLWFCFSILGEVERAGNHFKQATRYGQEIDYTMPGLRYWHGTHFWILGQNEKCDAAAAELSTILKGKDGTERIGWLHSLEWLAHLRADHQALLDYSQERLQLEMHNPYYDDLMAPPRDFIGHALAGMGHSIESEKAYEKALSQSPYPDWDENPLDISGNALNTFAGLARLALGCGDLEKALTHVEEILALDQRELPGVAASHENGIPVDSIIDLTFEWARIYMTCYRVLQAKQDPRAGEILRRAYDQVQNRADKISDEDIRRSFLENNSWHREVVEAWEMYQGGS
jgi:DNA-binding SARP family transcriptional activator